MSARMIFSGLQIVTEREILRDHAVVITGGVVQAIIPNAEVKKYLPAVQKEFPRSCALLPGFIDLHIHGARGCDVMDAETQALETISAALAAAGVTHFLATTMTAEQSAIEAALHHVHQYRGKMSRTGAQILGVHLEGPFISRHKVGAQRAQPILEPNYELIQSWQKLSGNAIKMVTLAPETEDALTVITQLKKAGIIAAIGHTDATYEATQAAIQHGSCHATHLFNAMRGMHHREPGALGALLLADQVTAELIVDGIHVHPAMIDLAWRVKGKEKIILVTDAMRAQCLGDGAFDLGGQQVTVHNGCAALPDGTLAGSTLTMPQALRNMMSMIGCSLLDVSAMTSANPARKLGLFDKLGSIAVGKAANFVVLDEQFGVVMTLRDGEVIYRKSDV